MSGIDVTKLQTLLNAGDRGGFYYAYAQMVKAASPTTFNQGLRCQGYGARLRCQFTEYTKYAMVIAWFVFVVLLFLVLRIM